MKALINMVCELKITSGSKKKLCKNSMVIRHSVKELFANNSVTRSMKYTVELHKVYVCSYKSKTSELLTRL